MYQDARSLVVPKLESYSTEASSVHVHDSTGWLLLACDSTDRNVTALDDPRLFDLHEATQIEVQVRPYLSSSTHQPPLRSITSRIPLF
jgi:hypothetical protein